MNAQLIHKAVGLPYSLTRLAPVSDVDCLGGAYIPIIGKMTPNKKISIGADPVNSWFDGNLHEEIPVCVATYATLPLYYITLLSKWQNDTAVPTVVPKKVLTDRLIDLY